MIVSHPLGPGLWWVSCLLLAPAARSDPCRGTPAVGPRSTGFFLPPSPSRSITPFPVLVFFSPFCFTAPPSCSALLALAANAQAKAGSDFWQTWEEVQQELHRRSLAAGTKPNIIFILLDDADQRLGVRRCKRGLPSPLTPHILMFSTQSCIRSPHARSFTSTKVVSFMPLHDAHESHTIIHLQEMLLVT